MVKLIVYNWPESQICLTCKNGEFVESESLCSSDYICTVGEENNDGMFCPSFDPKEEGDINQNNQYAEEGKDPYEHRVIASSHEEAYHKLYPSGSPTPVKIIQAYGIAKEFVN